MVVIVALAIWKISDLLVSYLAPNFIKYLGFFPYKHFLSWSELPKFITSFANFDGMHYITIAYQGYLRYEEVFFPAYPILLRGFHLLIKDYFLVGLIISNAVFIIGFIFFKKYLTLLKLSPNIILWTMLLLLSFPTSFFFGALYTEGLFFLLLILSFYFLHKKRYFWASLCGILASLTRFIGVFLFIPFGVIVIFQWLKNKKMNPWILLTVASPLLGLAMYSFYLFSTTSDPFAFFHSQQVFQGRSMKIILLPQVYFRYLKIIASMQISFPYLISVLEFTIFNFVFIILSIDLYKLVKKKTYLHNPHRIALSVFSFANLIVPTVTGTLASIPRYVLFSLSFFIFLGEIKRNSIKILLITIFVILHIILLAFFIQGYFIS